MDQQQFGGANVKTILMDVARTLEADDLKAFLQVIVFRICLVEKLSKLSGQKIYYQMHLHGKTKPASPLSHCVLLTHTVLFHFSIGSLTFFVMKPSFEMHFSILGI